MTIKILINKIFSFIERHSLLFVLVGFISVNLFFNFNAYVSELWHDQSLDGAVVGEVLASEWGIEIIYQRIKNFENKCSLSVREDFETHFNKMVPAKISS